MAGEEYLRDLERAWSGVVGVLREDASQFTQERRAERDDFLRTHLPFLIRDGFVFLKAIFRDYRVEVQKNLTLQELIEKATARKPIKASLTKSSGAKLKTKKKKKEIVKKEIKPIIYFHLSLSLKWQCTRWMG